MQQSAERACAVVPLFVLDPDLTGSSGANRLAFLFEALQSLRDAGVPLLVRSGTPARVFEDLVRERNVVEVVCANDYSPYGVRRDRQVADVLDRSGVPLRMVGSPYVVDPGSVRKDDGTPFKVFTPFKRVWERQVSALLAVPREASTDPLVVPWDRSESKPAGEIPDQPLHSSGLPTASERAAHGRLDAFLENHLHTYDSSRNDPGADATSRLSADLKFGLLHPRQIVPLLGGGTIGADVFRSELCWREFYADVLWHRPETARQCYLPAMESIRVDTGALADERFAAWCEGRTGFPFIDAGMRQLLAEGWMHNRVRMAAASFLVKDLHIDWRRGAAWFMEQLVDGDVASNQHGWQWTAGTGTDASPYYRVFNPVTQGKKFDPKGVYVRRFIPEIASLSDKDIHEPWLAPEASSLFGASIDTYPAPIVDHAAERIEALNRYSEAKLPKS